MGGLTIMNGIIRKKGYAILIVLHILSGVLFISAPMILNRIIGDTGHIRSSDILTAAFFLVAAYFIQFLTVIIQNKLYKEMALDFSGRMYSEIFRMKYDSLLQMGPSVIVQRTETAAGGYISFILHTLPVLMVNILIIGITLFMAASVSLPATILMVLTVPIQYLGFRILNKKLSERSVELSEKSGEGFSRVISVLSQTDFIKQNGTNEFLIPGIKRYFEPYQEVRKKLNYLAMGASGLLAGAGQLLQTMTVIILSAAALNSPGYFGNVIFIIMIIPYFSSSVRTMSAVGLGFSDYHAAVEFIKKITGEKESDGNTDPPENITEIKFDVPSLKIGDKEILKDINLEFKRGDVVGIMGESGKGKSTLLKLIPKFRLEETVYVDRIPLETIKNDSCRKKVSYYSQNSPIISDTLLNNLNFGREEFPEEEYRKIHFLSKFDDYNIKINEGGTNLSGGDRQRIALARFFTEKSEIVLLDEPTQSLDKETEKEILDEIIKNHESRIIFLITHDEELMRYCTHKASIIDGTIKVEKLPA